jgi:hypothetical protein
VIERRRTQRQAAEQLGLCERQVRRLCRALSEHGAAGLVSRKRGRPSNRKLPAAVRDEALEDLLDIGLARRHRRPVAVEGSSISQKSSGNGVVRPRSVRS